MVMGRGAFPTSGDTVRRYRATIPANVERRPSYGPNSPSIGERGARTRRAIVDAALACFDANGLQATTVDDIADRAGIARATLYQYFESKEQLFIELLRVSAGDLLRVIRRLGALGPTPEGYDNLHWWLGEWAWVQDKYKALHLQWEVIDSPGASLRPLMAEYVVSYVSALAPRLTAALGDDDIDVEGVTTVLLPLLFRLNDYRRREMTRMLSDDALLDAVATFVQLALFPSTPASALSAPAEPPQLPRARPAQRPPRRRPTAAPPRSDSGPAGDADAPDTVQRLLEAGAAVFAARGFHATSVRDVLEAARAGRGTFYRHFDDKTGLLVALSRECMAEFERLARQLAYVAGEHDPASLRRWLAEAIALHRRYRGVFRALLQEAARHPALEEILARSGAAILHAFDDALAGVERDHPFDVRAGSLVLLALLERGPDYAFGTPYDLDDERVVKVLACLIERGLLGSQRLRARPTDDG